jgi:hypothetical protein
MDEPTIETAGGLSPMLESFFDRAEEVRYTHLCTYELLLESLVAMLTRFGPMHATMTAQWQSRRKDADDDEEDKRLQSKCWDSMINKLWDKVAIAESRTKVKKPRSISKSGVKSESSGDSAEAKSKPKSKGKGGGKGADKGVCWKFQAGECTYGESCKFAHTKAVRQVGADETSEVSHSESSDAGIKLKNIFSYVKKCEDCFSSEFQSRHDGADENRCRNVFSGKKSLAVTTSPQLQPASHNMYSVLQCDAGAEAVNIRQAQIESAIKTLTKELSAKKKSQSWKRKRERKNRRKLNSVKNPSLWGL